MSPIILVSGGLGLFLIAATLVVAVIVIAGVWTFAARRGSRVPERAPHRRDHGVRDSS
jgi:hypothetical protein